MAGFLDDQVFVGFLVVISKKTIWQVSRTAIRASFSLSVCLSMISPSDTERIPHASEFPGHLPHPFVGGLLRIWVISTPFIQRTRGSLPATKPSACPSPLQPTGAPSSQIPLQRLHPFQALRCRGLAKTCSHQRHLLIVPLKASEAQPASSGCPGSLAEGGCFQHSPLNKNPSCGGGNYYSIKTCRRISVSE